ncbi:MAG: amidohydrolase family protein [Chthoniobacteraceae bacterium]|jgi:cytosine/adenosine deaminase-related metal-dependent hydrolase
MIIRARTILPMTGGPPIENGAVAVDRTRIRAVGKAREIAAHYAGPVTDLGEQVLMPGLINAHCHLDYTMMRRAIQPPRGFTAWVQRLNALKRSLRDDDYLAAIGKGFAELRKWGTTTVLNIESFPELIERLPAPPIRTWWFYEMIDIRQGKLTKELLDGADSFFCKREGWLGGFGLSPHAPYTTSAALYRAAGARARKLRIPVTTHLAESVEETAMFERASGPLYDFLKSLGREMSDCGRGSPLKVMMSQRLIGRGWIVAHMNQLDEGDFALLKKTPLHIVHCPASHRYFNHQPFAMERLRAMGMNISLGTDSLASADWLNLFHEMRNVCDRHASVSPLEAIEMVTVNPARALGRARELGRIAPRAWADMIALPIVAGAKELCEEIVWHRRVVGWQMVNGKILS